MAYWIGTELARRFKGVLIDYLSELHRLYISGFAKVPIKKRSKVLWEVLTEFANEEKDERLKKLFLQAKDILFLMLEDEPYEGRLFILLHRISNRIDELSLTDKDFLVAGRRERTKE